jgi:hypothetical protein
MPLDAEGLSRKSQHRETFSILVGLASITFSVVYLASDVIEVAQGNLSTFRLALTLAGEVAIPAFVMALYAIQCPRIRQLGLFGAVAYSYSYVFFTATLCSMPLSREAETTRPSRSSLVCG